MRSPADAALVAREPNLPGLALALDADALQQLIAGRAGLSIDRLEVRYLRYQPQTKCLAAVRIETGGEVRSAYLKCYHRADAARWSKVAARGESSAGGAGTGRIVWPDLASELIWFPSDDRIDHLGQLFDETYRTALLTRICPELPELAGARLATLNYKPERRFVGALADARTTHAVVKIYTAGSFPASLMRARALRDAQLPFAPQLIGRSKRRQLLLFRWESGDVLADHLNASDATAPVTATGRTLAQLHATRCLALPVRTGRDEQAAWDAARSFLTWVNPASARQLAELDQRLRAAAFDERAERVPVHGDFYAKQVLHHAGEIRLLDFDEAALGDPLSDLGNWCAKLEAAVLLGRLEASRRDELNAALLAGYGQASRTAALNAATALRLLVHAPHFFRSGVANWLDLTQAAVERAARLLDLGRFDLQERTGPGAMSQRKGGTLAAQSSSRPAPRAAGVPPLQFIESLSPVTTARRDSGEMGMSDPAMPFLAEALNARRAEEEFAAALALPAGTLQLASARICRHKPGRRCLIEYKGTITEPPGVSRPFTWLGKVRARGLDRRTPDLLRRLAREGFHPTCGDCISVPEVIGEVAPFQLWLQRVAPGRPLTELLDTRAGLDGCRLAARALSKLQASAVRPDRRHSVADELAILEKALARARQTRPDLHAEIDEIEVACAVAVRALPNSPTTLTHRDYYPDQLLVDGLRVVILDLDLAATGDPHLDAGNFLAHLTEHGLRHHDEADALAPCERVFQETWLELQPGAEAARLEIWRTLALARHIGLSTQLPGRAHTTDALVQLCRSRLELATPALIAS